MTKKARAMKRRMALATLVACDKVGDGNGCKSNGDEGDGQATVTRAMGMAKTTPWAIVMVMRLAGNKESKGKGSKGNSDDNEGGG